MSSARPTTAEVKALTGLALFRDLGSDGISRLLKSARFETFEPGAVITEMGAAADAMFVLVRGEIAVTREGRLVTLTAAPALLGLVSIIDGQRRSASLSAFSESAMFVIGAAEFEDMQAASPLLKRNLQVELAGEVRRLYDRQDTLMRHFDDFFESPNARLVPGPYVGENFDQYLFVMEDAPETLQRLMPRGCALIPGMGGRYLLTFNFFPGLTTKHPAGNGKSFAYAETTPFIPCRVTPARGPLPSRLGLFCPELYPDNYLAIALGRELYGFPKRFALTTRMPDHVDVVMGGRMILRAAWSRQTPVSPERFVRDCGATMLGGKLLGQLMGPLEAAIFALFRRTLSGPRERWPAMPVFVHKQIPDVVSEDEVVYAIDELAEIPFRVTGLSDFSRLTGADVRFLADDWFLGGRCLEAWRFKMSFGFGRGRAIIDYRVGTAAPSRPTTARSLMGRVVPWLRT